MRSEIAVAQVAEPKALFVKLSDITLVQIRIWDFEAKKAEHLIA
jgi:hypothetical protein